MLAPLFRIPPLLVLVLAAATAQTRISLANGGAPRSPLQQRIIELAMPDKQVAAMDALWRGGPAAVPLLAAEVERAGASAMLALAVLERLGGEAVQAVPVLKRAAANAKGPTLARLLAVTAKLDGPPCILVSRHNDNEIAQLDFDGKVIRSIKCNNPWGAWPMPGDHVGAVDFGGGKIAEFDWAGTEIKSTVVHPSLTAWRQLDNGDQLATGWQKKGTLARLAPDNTVVWEIEVAPIRIDLHWLERTFAITRENPRIVSLDADGKELATVPLPCLCHGFRMLPTGNFLVCDPKGRVLELDPDGKQVREVKIDGKPNDALPLRDGRLLIATEANTVMLGADGKELWRAELGYCGPMFVRVPLDR
ncbi:MAG: hypothetical protein IPK26_17280 [Planctomycetes bacterium]|nr:hypothetical protein [Planctomycetota bacterium]